jgi:CBS domain containing-hemolysin-like protein
MGWTILGIVATALAAMMFSTVTYAVRDFSRTRLEQYLVSYRKTKWLEYTIANQHELAFVTAVGRLLTTILLVLLSLRLFHDAQERPWVQYGLAALLAAALSTVFALAMPMALARHAGESILATSIGLLHVLRLVLLPVTKVMHGIDAIVRRIAGARPDVEAEEIENEILSAVEEGVKEGVVDKQERQIIESVIEFRDTQAGQIMTARPDIVALEVGARLEEVKRTIEESGHSRVPVYDGTLDHIVGILYARDLLRYLGGTMLEGFDLRGVVRSPLFVPETKPLRDLLMEFRLQKVHIAIVLDEYGGTAGLLTIEDILEELVGEISDEHEPQEPPMIKRIDDQTFDVDARVYVGDVNRQCGLSLPEDAGYDTIGGFATATVGAIPQQGTTFEHDGARYTVLDAEPQRVKRLKVELLPQPSAVEDAR